MTPKHKTYSKKPIVPNDAHNKLNLINTILSIGYQWIEIYPFYTETVVRRNEMHTKCTETACRCNEMYVQRTEIYAPRAEMSARHTEIHKPCTEIRMP